MKGHPGNELQVVHPRLLFGDIEEFKKSKAVLMSKINLTL